MKTKIYFSFLFTLFFVNSFSQTVTVNSSGCNSRQFTFSFVDSTGRNFLGGITDAILWNSAANEWEWADFATGTPVIYYSNSYASTPNPPCFNTGTWVQGNAGCGTISDITGDCQSSITAILNNEDPGKYFSIVTNPASGNIIILLNSPIIQKMTVSIFNSIGEKICEQVVSSPQTELALSNLRNGIYFAQLNSNEGFFLKKFLFSR